MSYLKVIAIGALSGAVLYVLVVKSLAGRELDEHTSASSSGRRGEWWRCWRAHLAIRTRDAIEALLEDGYPEEPMPEVDHEVTDNLDQNRDTIEYARSRFKVRQLTTKGAFEAGEQHAPS